VSGARFSTEAEAAVMEGLPKSGHEPAAKDATQNYVKNSKAAAWLLAIIAMLVQPVFWLSFAIRYSLRQ
jgi:hypothetical protein